MTLEHNLNMLEREKDKLDEKYTRYASYEAGSRESDEVRKQQSQQFGFDSMSTEQMEARYEAITSVLSQELKNLEEQERRSAARYQREKEDLDYLQKKYHLKPEQWSGVMIGKEFMSNIFIQWQTLPSLDIILNIAILPLLRKETWRKVSKTVRSG